ncbi:uncharacterized protein LOC106172143 [Lingula anatina]|uniref:Uncharacterized protein LOC106172143 n=1 Tax=Lingula anatina TaxID=7574 RepID=A0A1S3JE95_LINAN|nr:uncharacterized protein LOC106172143 [Lingula anatina]|eukprot:XP_013408209.1 uncharacterized protein LOC106172143 [Lingula anatina]
MYRSMSTFLQLSRQACLQFSRGKHVVITPVDKPRFFGINKVIILGSLASVVRNPGNDDSFYTFTLANNRTVDGNKNIATFHDVKVDGRIAPRNIMDLQPG